MKNEKELSEIKEEIYKCSKCGLCQAVCPLYIATKNEMFLSRGRYVVLNNFFNFNKPLSKKFVKELDVCLNCNACKNFCPSCIDSYKTLVFLKNKFNYKYGLLPFSSIYTFILIYSAIQKKFFNLPFVKNIFKNSYSFDLYNLKIKRNKKKNYPDKKGKVIFFEGCFNRYINQGDKNAALNIIESLNYEIIKTDFQCCGYPLLSEGNINKLKKQTKKLIKKLNKGCDYIVCTCDTCFDTLKRLPDYVPEANVFIDKLIRFDEFLKLNNYKIPEMKNLVYHKPLLKEEKDSSFESIERMNKKGSCSLMENFFILKYKKLSEILVKNVFYNTVDIKNNDVMTTCLLSKWGLKKGFYLQKKKVDVYTFAEIIFLKNENKY